MITTFTLKSILHNSLVVLSMLALTTINAQTNPGKLTIDAANIPDVTLSDDTPPVLIAISDQIVKKPLAIKKSPKNPIALSITIIESQSINAGHDMDVKWQNVATMMGNSAVIEPQTSLDNTDIIGFTDILIISSGVIDIPLSRRAVIQQFIENGIPVYLQSEYMSSFQSNETFQQIVENLGGSFTWGETMAGVLSPMNISGPISNTPNDVPSLSYYWYGCAGSGDITIEQNMEYYGQYFGFIFTPPVAGYGILMTNSDQDWVREAPENELLMENILTYLGTMIQTGVRDQSFGDNLISNKIYQNYPNPVTSITSIKYALAEPGFVTIKVLNLLGMEKETLVSDFQPAGDHFAIFEKADLPEGPYFYQLKLGDKIVGTKKMMLR